MLENDYDKKKSSYYDVYRQDILSLLPRHVEKVLEVGCGNGNTLAYLKANNYCDWICGIELFPESAAIAQGKVDLLFQGNIEDFDIPLEPNSIDLILCLDVLEHLVNPAAVVKKLHQYLTKDGIIIASIPNVRHSSVLLPLLFQNKWEYQDAGVLDRTHLRFFVEKTAIDLMTCSGLKLIKVAHNPGYVGSIIFNILTLGLLRSLLALQYLVKVGR